MIDFSNRKIYYAMKTKITFHMGVSTFNIYLYEGIKFNDGSI